MSTRYLRQQILPGVGTAGQAKLAASSVLVVGTGGLGSPVLTMLAGAGLGRLIVVDHDRVEESNLHRQPLFKMHDIGRPKVEAARDALQAYNPEVAIEAELARLGPANAGGLVARADIVVDAADSLAVTYMLSDACQVAAKPLVSASVLGQQGYVGAFCGGGPSYRAVFPDMPSTVGSCATDGVLGSAVGVLGSLQAHLVLQLVLGLAPSPLGRLVTVDLARLAFGGFRFDGVPEPAEAAAPFVERDAICPTDYVVDLRSEQEAPLPVTPTAVRLSNLQIEQVPGMLPRDRRVVLCCRSGVRAQRAARVLQAHAFTDLALLAAGG